MKAPKARPRATEARAVPPTLTDEPGHERQPAAPALGTEAEESLLAKLKPPPAPVIQEKEPLPGSLDAGWEDPPSASEPADAVSERAPEGAKTAPPPPSDGAKTAPPPLSDVAKTAPPPPPDVAKTAPPPPPDVAKTAPPPGLPTPLLPGPILGADGIVRLNDSDYPGDEPTKVGDSLIESMRGGAIAKLADEEDEASQEGLTVIGNSLVQSGTSDAPDIAALTAMRPSGQPNVAPAPPSSVPAQTIDDLPKLGEADESGPSPSAPPSKDLEATPASQDDASKPEGDPAQPPLAARPAWMSSRYAIVAVLLALVMALVAMRLLRH